MYRFHVNLFAVPTHAVEGSPITLRGVELARLTNGAGAPPAFDQPLEPPWETVAERLEQLPRMIFEPDGSWVWSGECDGQRWQVDGQFFELRFAQGPRLHRVEVHGTCPQAEFDALLGAHGWPDAPLVFELVMEGVTLTEESCRKWAAAGAGDGPAHDGG